MSVLWQTNIQAQVSQIQQKKFLDVRSMWKKIYIDVYSRQPYTTRRMKNKKNTVCYSYLASLATTFAELSAFAMMEPLHAMTNCPKTFIKFLIKIFHYLIFVRSFFSFHKK